MQKARNDPAIRNLEHIICLLVGLSHMAECGNASQAIVDALWRCLDDATRACKLLEEDSKNAQAGS